MTILPRSLLTMIMVLGITGGIGGARLVRSAVIAIQSNTYISASDAIGCSPVRILLVHIIPNIMPTLIIMFTLGIGGNILAEAGLSFLGFRSAARSTSWGVLINSARHTCRQTRSWRYGGPGAFAGSLWHEYVWRQHQGPSRPSFKRRCRALCSLR